MLFSYLSFALPNHFSPFPHCYLLMSYKVLNVWKRKKKLSVYCSSISTTGVIDILCFLSVADLMQTIREQQICSKLWIWDKPWYKILKIVSIRYYISVLTWTFNTNCSWCRGIIPKTQHTATDMAIFLSLLYW